MASTTLSIRVPADTRRWLEQFARKRGSAGSAAARLLEEAKRQERFRGIEFRDTPLGRIPYVQGTRVQVAFAWMAAKDYGFDVSRVAGHFGWPLWKAESALAYAEAFAEEIRQEIQDLETVEFEALRRQLPGVSLFEA